MVAVVAVALAMGGVVFGVRLEQRHHYFMVRIRHHERVAHTSSYNVREFRESLRRMERESGQRGSPLVFFENQRRFADYIDRVVAYHAAMASKYRHAARYPWLPTELDPPEP